MNHGVGSLEWARRTGGRMSLGDRLGQLALAAAFQLRVLPAQVLSQRGVTWPHALKMDLAELNPPESDLALRAETLLRTVMADHLRLHSIRSYLWARVFAAQHSIGFDDELLYLGAMLHDIGLTAKFAPTPDQHCFTLASADAAIAVARELSWPAERQDALAEAITLHVNVRVGLGKGPEAHLLNAATALDVTGLRLWEIPQEAVEHVLKGWPRAGFPEKFPAEWRAEAEARPQSRAAFLSRWLQFESRIARNRMDH